MKTNISLFTAIFLLISISAFSQLKVNSSGKVGIGIDPDGYDLCLQNAIFKSTGGSYPNLIISGDVVQGRAIFPSMNNQCSVGLSNYQFRNIYGQYHYANTTLLTSDKRLKEKLSYY